MADEIDWHLLQQGYGLLQENPIVRVDEQIGPGQLFISLPGTTLQLVEIVSTDTARAGYADKIPGVLVVQGGRQSGALLFIVGGPGYIAVLAIVFVEKINRCALDDHHFTIAEADQ